LLSKVCYNRGVMRKGRGFQVFYSQQESAIEVQVSPNAKDTALANTFEKEVT